MLDKANKMLDFNLLDLCLKGPETELEKLGGIEWWAQNFPMGLAAFQALVAVRKEGVFQF